MSDYKIPNLAKGNKVPEAMLQKQFLEAKEEELRKKQFRHDWLIACFSGVTGAIFGFITSLIFWMITK